MKKNLGAKAILYPMPVLVVGTYDENGVANAMTAAWGGISEETEITICISDEHKTAKNLEVHKGFTVGIADVANMKAADFVGIVSGNKDSAKVEKTGWTVEKSSFVDAPIFAELPMVLECEVISYDAPSCRLIGRIVNVAAEERVFNEDGKLDIAKFNPITYDPMNHTYHAIGECVGKAFANSKL